MKLSWILTLLGFITGLDASSEIEVTTANGETLTQPVAHKAGLTWTEPPSLSPPASTAHSGSVSDGLRSRPDAETSRGSARTLSDGSSSQGAELSTDLSGPGWMTSELTSTLGRASSPSTASSAAVTSTGQPTDTATSTVFGSSPTSKPSTVFGSSPTSKPSTVFGSSPTSKPSTVFGSSPTSKPSTVFGSSPTSKPSTVFGSSPTSKPSTVFGSSPTSKPSTVFGSSPTSEPAALSDSSTQSQPANASTSLRTPSTQSGFNYLAVLVIIPIFAIALAVLISCYIARRKRRHSQSFAPQRKKKGRADDAWAGPVSLPEDGGLVEEAEEKGGEDLSSKRTSLSISTFFAKRKSRAASVLLEEVSPPAQDLPNGQAATGTPSPGWNAAEPSSGDPADQTPGEQEPLLPPSPPPVQPNGHLPRPETVEDWPSSDFPLPPPLDNAPLSVPEGESGGGEKPHPSPMKTSF